MGTKRVTLTLTKDIIDSIDKTIDSGTYISRSEIVREALRRFLKIGEQNG